MSLEIRVIDSPHHSRVDYGARAYRCFFPSFIEVVLSGAKTDGRACAAPARFLASDSILAMAASMARLNVVDFPSEMKVTFGQINSLSGVERCFKVDNKDDEIPNFTLPYYWHT